MNICEKVIQNAIKLKQIESLKKLQTLINDGLKTLNTIEIDTIAIANIDRNKTEEILKNEPIGVYILRTSNKGEFAISYLLDDLTLSHIAIFLDKDKGLYNNQNTYFKSFKEFKDFFKDYKEIDYKSHEIETITLSLKFENEKYMIDRNQSAGKVKKSKSKKSKKYKSKK